MHRGIDEKACRLRLPAFLAKDGRRGGPGRPGIERTNHRRAPRRIAVGVVTDGGMVRRALRLQVKHGIYLLFAGDRPGEEIRSEEHTSELQSLMRISYAVFCLKKK